MMQTTKIHWTATYGPDGLEGDFFPDTAKGRSLHARQASYDENEHSRGRLEAHSHGSDDIPFVPPPVLIELLREFTTAAHETRDGFNAKGIAAPHSLALAAEKARTFLRDHGVEP